MTQDRRTKRIAILGSTGSIGTQALDVVAAHPEVFTVELLTAQNNVDLLAAQARRFGVRTVVIENETKYDDLCRALAGTSTKVLAGPANIAEAVTHPMIEVVLTALVGFSGVRPTMRAIAAGKTIALANKETLVVAGALVTSLARQKNVAIYPVDSEHSAIFQCLAGEEHNPIEKIILTASGGPFRGKKRNELAQVTRDQALKHPNWTMGAKVTIDSASLMNKGLEVIEAKWLFDLEAEQIEVVVHPQSIIHSLVQFRDGSIKAQLGLPDMRLPIQYAMGYPNRLVSDWPRFRFTDFPALTFESPDTETFRNLALAFEALRRGGNVPCIMNAANEIAVRDFLDGRIGFLDMSELVSWCMEQVSHQAEPSLDDLIATDEETRRLATEWVTKRN